MTRPRSRPSRGFTLVEMIFVLVVFGLLLGGVLKTTEMINGAKVKALSNQQTSIQFAWYTFIDRYGGMPTKVQYIRDYLPDVTFQNSINVGAGVRLANQYIPPDHSAAVFYQLVTAGLLKCRECRQDHGVGFPTADNSPVNIYGGVLAILHDTGGAEVFARSPGEARGNRVMLNMGNHLPSNLLAEFDRKNDDGVPHKGTIRFSSKGGLGFGLPTAPLSNIDPRECMNRRADGANAGRTNDIARYDVMYWRPTGSRPPVYGNCSATVLL